MIRDSSPARTTVTFFVTVAAWVVGLFGLFRLPLVQQYALVPFAQAQQGIAVALFGVSPSAIVVDVSCTGSDAMALALGAVLGFPATWKQRRQGVAIGFVLITLLNTLRIATLSMAAGVPATFDLLHVYVWPGLIILGAVAWVFRWMQSATAGGPVSTASADPWGVAGSSGWRFGVTATVLVAGYFAAFPWILGRPALQTASVWSASVARMIMAGSGVTSSVTGNLLIAGGRPWLITPECIVTPLIPVYVATVLYWPTTPFRRGVALALAPPLFLSLGVVRLLVLALPASLAVHTVALHAFYQVGLALLLVAFAVKLTTPELGVPAGRMRRRGALAISAGAVAALAYAAGVALIARPLTGLLGGTLLHLGHGYVDGQGALMILPASQVGLFIALWVATGEDLRSARIPAGLMVLFLQQSTLGLALGELHAHAGFELPIVAIRACAILVPVALVWLLRRDRSMLGPLPTPGAVLSG